LDFCFERGPHGRDMPDGVIMFIGER
jgi:hypothetical protein